MICKNCDAAFESSFCPSCGQNAKVHKITLGHVAHDFVHAFTHADKGFLLLVKGLLTRPGIIAREYVEGKRKKYFNPLTFLVLTSAVSAFVLTAVHYYDYASAGSQRQSARPSHPMIIETFRISNDNQKLLSLLLLTPLITLLTWFFFRKKKYNLAENFVLNSFVIGESHIVRLLVFVPLFLLMPELGRQLIYVFEGVLLVYLIVAYKQFFGQNTVLTALKTILIMPLYILIYWVLIFSYVYVKHQLTA